MFFLICFYVLYANLFTRLLQIHSNFKYCKVNVSYFDDKWCKCVFTVVYSEYSACKSQIVMDKTSGAFWGFYPFDMLYVFPMLLCLDSVLSVRHVIVIYIICAVGLSLFYQKRNYVPCIKLILQGRSFWSITWVNSWNIDLFHQPLLILFTPNLTEPSSLARL